MNAAEQDLIVLSFHPADSVWLQRLESHLTPHLRERSLALWSKARLMGGAVPEEELPRALTQARAVVVLISPDYLTSNALMTQELPQILDRVRDGGVKLLGLPLRPAAYELSGLTTYPALMDPERPLSVVWESAEAHGEQALEVVAKLILAAITPAKQQPSRTQTWRWPRERLKRSATRSLAGLVALGLSIVVGVFGSTRSSTRAQCEADADLRSSCNRGDCDGLARHHQLCCTMSVAESCVTVGTLQESGKSGDPQSVRRAAENYQRGCLLGARGGCFNWASLLAEGEGANRHEAAAACMLRALCEPGQPGPACATLLPSSRWSRPEAVPKACSALGKMYESGYRDATGLVQDEERAAYYYLQGCTGNHAPGCSLLGTLKLWPQRLQPEPAIGFEYLHRACTLMRFGPACTNLGLAYRIGVPKFLKAEPESALAFFKDACQLGRGAGDSSGCYKHGLALDELGRFAEAAVVYDDACLMLRDARSCNNAAMLFEPGQKGTLSQDEGKFVHYLALGCDYGEGRSCHSLAEFYKARGDASHEQQARRLACKQGKSEDCPH